VWMDEVISAWRSMVLIVRELGWWNQVLGGELH